MDSLFQDLRSSWRAMAKRPMFYALLAGILALGIGVNTAVFSLVYTIFVAGMPIGEPDAVVFLHGTENRSGGDRLRLAPADFLDLRERAQSFSRLAALGEGSVSLTGDSMTPVRVRMLQVSANLPTVWQVGAAEGRVFLPGEDTPGASPTLLLSHGFWKSQFGGDPAVVGRSLELDGVEHTVVGVVEPRIGRGSLGAFDVWSPLTLERATAVRGERRLVVTGELALGVSVEEAQAEIAGLAARLESEHPESHHGWGIAVRPTREALMNRETQAVVFLLVLTVGAVLLIACANCANLLLARAGARRREMAVRVALGAGRARLVRQMLVESAFTALAAGAFGLLLTRALFEVMRSIAGAVEPLFLGLGIDQNVLLFTLAIALATPFIFALPPALGAARAEPRDALQAGGSRSGNGRRAGRLRRGLVVGQMALALMLMVVAGLLVRTMINLQTYPPGFAAEGLLSLRLELPASGDGSAGAERFFDRVQEGFTALPGVVGVERVSRRPTAGGAPRREVWPVGRSAPPDGALPRADIYTVTPGYFELMGIERLAGRDFLAADDEGAVPVAILNRFAARQLFGDQAPAGQRLEIAAGEDEGTAPRVVEVVGVVENVVSANVVDNQTHAPEIFLPVAQAPARETAFVLRVGHGDPAVLADAARRVVWELDAELPIADLRTMERLLRDGQASAMALVTLFAIFAGLALVLAASGVYGVMSFMVARRRHEIGVRMALGAGAREIRRLILSDGGRLMAIGGALGLVGAWGLARLLENVVFEIRAHDPGTFGGVTVLLIGCGLAASAIPAWRASRADPLRALRSD